MVRCADIEAGEWRAEAGTGFELAASIASALGGARASGRFPVVLVGNTPETTVSSFLDGMALATVAGRWRANWTRRKSMRSWAGTSDEWALPGSATPPRCASRATAP